MGKIDQYIPPDGRFHMLDSYAGKAQMASDVYGIDRNGWVEVALDLRRTDGKLFVDAKDLEGDTMATMILRDLGPATIMRLHGFKIRVSDG